MKGYSCLRGCHQGTRILLRPADRHHTSSFRGVGGPLWQRHSAKNPFKLHQRDGPILLPTYSQSRSVFTGSIPTVLLPPAAFVGFFVTLWVYKCCMMVLFQNKIIYMPGLPPGARQEKIEDYQKQCGSIGWEEKHIGSLDGTDLALCISASSANERSEIAGTKHIIILYFQG